MRARSIASLKRFVFGDRPICTKCRTRPIVELTLDLCAFCHRIQLSQEIDKMLMVYKDSQIQTIRESFLYLVTQLMGKKIIAGTEIKDNRIYFHLDDGGTNTVSLSEIFSF